jgi:hypothetical protein
VRFRKQDFIYQPETNAYRCPVGERLTWRFTAVENGLTLSAYWVQHPRSRPSVP